MSEINVLFYSNNCEGSKQLIFLMKHEKLDKYFHFICTDNNTKIPHQIKLTPTLIIRNVPTPYVAGEAFAWLSKIKQWKINMTLINLALKNITRLWIRKKHVVVSQAKQDTQQE